jgi:hypothetical protein
VAINATGNAPNASALLDMDGTNKGLLIPRVTFCHRVTPACPDGMLDGSGNLAAAAQGLLVYQTDAGTDGQGFYYNTSSTITPAWVKLLGGTPSSGWELTGNAGTTTGTNFLGTTDAVDLAIYTNSTERIRVNGVADANEGFVGIGTSNPEQTLDVAGDVEIGGGAADYDGTDEFLHINSQNQDWYIGVRNLATANLNDFHIGLTQAEDGIFHIEPGGNVGIGTTSPNATLEVSGNNNTNEAVKFTKSSGSATGDVVFIGAGNSAVDKLLNIQYGNAYVNTALVVKNGTGNVGIGTTSPDGKLDIEDGGLYLSEIAAPATPNTSKGVIYEKSDALLYFMNDAGTEFDLTVSDDGDWVTGSGVVYNTADNIGIGTTAPESLLEIAETGSFNLITYGPELTLRNTAIGINSTTNYEIGKINFAGNDRLGGEFGLGAQIRSVAKSYWNGTTNDNPAELQFWTNPNGPTPIQNRMTIDENGNVGIGTADPKVPLDIPSMGGLIIGLTHFDCGVSPTPSWTKLDAVYGKVTFIAPISGNVIIEVSAVVQDATGNCSMRLIDNNSNTYNNVRSNYIGWGNASSSVGAHWDENPFIIIGLTPGQQYTMYPEITGDNGWYIAGGMIKAISAPESSYILIE